MKVDIRAAALAVVIAAGLAYYFSDPSPDTTDDDRPVLRLIVRVARAFLWAAMFAEEPRPDQPYVQQTIGQDGYPTISHERSL